ncbi:hypothetical protein BDF14DRAFT_1883767 [Spinellus fusiger]|nr:hypothetical protein BDF14DRAFT_1883767 [Spinellus fusiger]
MISPPHFICPATCELCGYWMPQHNDNCPRNGVHPSQWTCLITVPLNLLDISFDTFYSKEDDSNNDTTTTTTTATATATISSSPIA